ncbi:hypothetical protein FXV91_06195 [Methanosarcina sp. DH2]|nr:hypothetical protein [Methanosarcina sp. DH2]MCC4769803.1 hypothetical protein [Methanosarcina sp. DH2]
MPSEKIGISMPVNIQQRILTWTTEEFGSGDTEVIADKRNESCMALHAS